MVCKASMFREMKAAMNEVVGKKKGEQKKQMEDDEKKLADEVVTKMEQLGELRLSDKGTNTDWKVLLDEYYTKKQGIVQVLYCKGCIQELMGLPEVMKQARMEIYSKTQNVFNSIMQVPPPPPPPPSY